MLPHRWPLFASDHIRISGGDPLQLRIMAQHAPALGDLRNAGEGDTIWVMPFARQRKDWGRYQDAIAQAVSRGADVRWFR